MIVRMLIPLLVVLVVVLLGMMLWRMAGASSAVPRSVFAEVAHVKDLAWDHRELEPVLAGALIERCRQFEAHPEARAVDDLAELAWAHREDSPNLSTIVIDEIR